MSNFDIVQHLECQREFSLKTFGPTTPERLEGTLKHIEKECHEIRLANYQDLEEWIDVVILGCDGALRLEDATMTASRLMGSFRSLSDRLTDLHKYEGTFDLEEFVRQIETVTTALFGYRAGLETAWAWVGIASTALFAACRIATPDQVIEALQAKLAKNIARTWPDWRTSAPGEPIEHVREGL